MKSDALFSHNDRMPTPRVAVYFRNSLAHPRTDRIEMNVANHLLQILLILC
ncbi:MAG: hypothetical protein JW795_14190 [Chitinivibrionales bacterium]|nr:hypothetical protein [Chitinivibrionales bacterium]